MAAALGIFVSAANQGTSALPGLASTPGVSIDCDALFHSLGAAGRQPAGEDHAQKGQTTLLAAFRRLCLVYSGHLQQVALCARVLAFYFLVEQSDGAILGGWTEPDAENERYIQLDPALVSAIASVPLQSSLLLSETRFLAWILSETEGEQALPH